MCLPILTRRPELELARGIVRTADYMIEQCQRLAEQANNAAQDFQLQPGA